MSVLGKILTPAPSTCTEKIGDVECHLNWFRICTQTFASFIPYRSRARVVDGTQIEAGGQGDYYSIEAGSQIVVEFVLIDNCVSQFCTSLLPRSKQSCNSDQFTTMIETESH